MKLIRNRTKETKKTHLDNFRDTWTDWDGFEETLRDLHTGI